MSLATQFERLVPNTILTIAGAGYQVGRLAKESDAGWPMGVVRSLSDLWRGDLIVVDYHAQIGRAHV